VSRHFDDLSCVPKMQTKTAKLMVFKLVMAAAKTWRRLKGENQLPKIIAGVRFQNGIERVAMADEALINLLGWCKRERESLQGTPSHVPGSM